MFIEYENSLNDIVDFNLYHFQHSQTGRRTQFKTQFIFPIILLVISIISFSIYKSIVRELPLVVFALLWIIFTPFYYKGYIKKYVTEMYREGKNKGVICKHKTTLSPESIINISEVGETSIRWAAVEKIELTDKYIFIYTSAASAIIVPKRAFSDESKYHEFFETAKRYREGVIAK